MSAKDILLEWVFPILGGIIGAIMFASPLPAVLTVRRERTLGDLNPMPYPLVTANCAAWIAYTYILTNRSASILIFWPNQLGLMLGLFYTLSCYPLSTTKTRDRQLAVLIVSAFVNTIIGATGAIGNFDSDSLKLLWGTTATVHTCIYYASPLSTIILVLKTRNSASLHWPLSLMNTLNGGLWCGYGLAIGDAFVWGPNGFGAILGGIVLLLILIFPNKVAKPSPAPSEVGLGNGNGNTTYVVEGEETHA